MYKKKGYLYSLFLWELNKFHDRLKINYSGLENIANRGYEQTIYAANHPSRFDPLLMIPTLLQKVENKNKIRIPAAQWIREKFPKLYTLKFFDWLAITFVGEDKEKNKYAMKQLEDHLRTYNHILIFPEGWYQRDGKMRPGRYGTSSIAFHCSTPEQDVKIVPTSITYYMKQRPKKKERPRGLLDLIWNIDEYLLDMIVEAKQYYYAEIDITFGKPISTNKIKEQSDMTDEAGVRRAITSTLMKEIGNLSTINMNQVLAQYLIKGYAQRRRVYDFEKIHEDIASITQKITQKQYYLKEHFVQLSPTLEQTLQLFEQQKIIRKKAISGEERYIIDKDCKEAFEIIPEPMEDDFKEKNFLHYTANQISHLSEVCTIIEENVSNR